MRRLLRPPTLPPSSSFPPPVLTLPLPLPDDHPLPPPSQPPTRATTSHPGVWTTANARRRWARGRARASPPSPPRCARQRGDPAGAPCPRHPHPHRRAHPQLLAGPGPVVVVAAAVGASRPTISSSTTTSGDWSQWPSSRACPSSWRSGACGGRWLVRDGGWDGDSGWACGKAGSAALPLHRAGARVIAGTHRVRGQRRAVTGAMGRVAARRSDGVRA